MTEVEKPNGDKSPEPSAVPRRAVVYVVAAMAVFVGGSTPTATKFAVLEIDPVLVGLLRSVLGGMAGLFLVALMRIPLPRRRRHFGFLALSASCGFVIFPVLFGIGQSLTSTAHSGLIFATIPVFVGIFASLLERRMPALYLWVGGAVALAGESFLIVFRGGLDTGGATLAGDALVLAAVVVLSLGFVIGARLTQEGYNAWGTTFWGLVAAGAVLAPFVPMAAAGTGWREAGVAAWGGVAYLVLISTSFGYVCLYWAFGKGGITKTGMLYFTTPVVTLALAVLMLGETLNAPLLVAAAVILGGVYVSQKS